MSYEKQLTVNQVSDNIKDLLNQGLKLSVEYVDTYYLYGKNNKDLVILTRTTVPGKTPEYNVVLSDSEMGKKLNQPQDIYKQFYNYVDKNYNAISNLEQKKEKTLMSDKDVQDMWFALFAHISVYDQRKFLKLLIIKLIDNRYPIDVISKVNYYFDRPHSKKSSSKTISFLNHDNKLSQYKTRRDNVWFFAGEKGSLQFKLMDKESVRIFNRVKFALQKQKQNVK